MATGFPVIKKCFCKGFKGPSLSYADIHTDGVDFNLLATNAEKEIKRNYFIIVLFVNAGEVYFGIDNFFAFVYWTKVLKKKTQPNETWNSVSDVDDIDTLYLIHPDFAVFIHRFIADPTTCHLKEFQWWLK